LPVPDSPVINTEESVGATFATISLTFATARLTPTSSCCLVTFNYLLKKLSTAFVYKTSTAADFTLSPQSVITAKVLKSAMPTGNLA